MEGLDDGERAPPVGSAEPGAAAMEGLHDGEPWDASDDFDGHAAAADESPLWSNTALLPCAPPPTPPPPPPPGSQSGSSESPAATRSAVGSPEEREPTLREVLSVLLSHLEIPGMLSKLSNLIIFEGAKILLLCNHLQVGDNNG